MIKYLISFLFLQLFLANSLYCQIPNLENRNKIKIKNEVLETFYRSMNKWDISFQDLLENKSGAACIEWNKLTNFFLTEGIFDALGYSQNIPNKKAAEIASISGCNKMKEYYKLDGKCECEVIVVNDKNAVKLPIKKVDIEKYFTEGVKKFKEEEYKLALKAFLKLSELGHRQSQYNLSIMNMKGLGITQNFGRAYYWSLSSQLYGEKNSRLIIKKSRLKISKEEKNELENELKDYLESLSIQGNFHAFLPLAQWYIKVPKKPDYNNCYKWLSIATAFNLKNAKKARDKISSYVDKREISSLQIEAKENYDKIVNNLKVKKEKEIEGG